MRSRPFEDANTVQHILDFAGPGHWAFYATVSKLWLEAYRLVPTKHLATRKLRIKFYYQYFEPTDVTPQTTLRSAVFASAFTVRLAHAYGLRFDYDSLQPIHDDNWIELQQYTGSVTTTAALNLQSPWVCPSQKSLLLGHMLPVLLQQCGTRTR
jgi:hypothetical protein